MTEKTVLEFSPIRRGAKKRLETSLQKLEDGDSLKPNQFCFRVMNENGDDRLVWDSKSLDELKEAKKAFVELVKQGMTPYRVGTNGKASAEIMKEFDPKAEEVIFMDTQLVTGG